MIRLLKYDVLLETEPFIEWIESMALQGWFIKYINEESFFVHFKKGEPQRLKYCVFTHRYRKFNSDEFIATANEQGWELVSKKGMELFLFKSALEEPLPLETDLSEVQRKNRTMTHGSLKELALYGILFAIYLKLANAWALSMLYGSILLLLLAIYTRRRYIEHPDKAKKRQVAKFLKVYNMGLVVTALLVMAFSIYRFTDSILVDGSSPESKLIHPQSLSVLNTVDIYKVEVRKSFFSFTPVSTSLIQFTDTQGYNRIIYSTQKRIFGRITESDLDDYYKSSQIYISTSLNRLTEWKKETGLRTYKNEKQDAEFLSVFVQGDTTYSLHTLNFAYDEHLELLGKMGDNP